MGMPLSELDLRQRDLSQVALKDAIFDRVQLTGAKLGPLDGAVLHGCTLDGATLTGGEGATFNSC
ncbi:MAG TPA: pentapeptide repeat-containing protein, partial [Kofleriaceae bacterium]